MTPASWLQSTLFVPGSPFIAKHAYRQDIDGLRAFAVLSVVVFHAFPNSLKSGFLGVDAFFVVSGFAITEVLLTEFRENRFSIAQFYLRRARRIFLGVLLVVLAVSVSWPLLFNQAESLLVRKEIASAGLFVSNIYYYNTSGYFSVGADRLALLHMWSLAVEEQFYLVFPWILTVAIKYERLAPVLAGLFVASLGSYLYSSYNDPDAAFFLLHNRGWQLLAGAGCAYVGTRTNLSNLWPRLFVSLVFGGMAMACVATDFRAWSAAPLGNIILTLSVVVLIATRALSVFDEFKLSVLASKIGLISFPLYIWHWPLLVAVNILQDGNHTWWLQTITVGAAVALSLLTLSLELPVRTRRQNARIPLAISIALVSVGLLAFHFPNLGTRIGTPLQAETDLDIQAWKLLHGQLPKCETKTELSILTWCFQTGPAPRYAMIGDSHADHYFVGLGKASDDWLLMGRNSCPPVASKLGRPAAPDKTDPYWSCRPATDVMIKQIIERPDITTVVYSFLGTYYIAQYPFAKQHREVIAKVSGRLPENQLDITNPVKLNLVAEGLRNGIKRLVAAGKTVVIVEDLPEMPFSPAACLHNWQIDPLLQRCSVPLKTWELRSKPYRQMIEALIRDFPNVRIHWTRQDYCDALECSVRKNGRMTYRDSHHLSVYGSELAAQRLLNWLSGTEFTRANDQHQIVDTNVKTAP